MRCKNCGWPNRPGVSICQKCGSPLDSDSSLNEMGENSSSSNINATVLENMPFEKQDSKEENKCPKCGFPLPDKNSKCPNCNYGAEQPTVADNGAQHRVTRMENHAIDNESIKGTINPYFMIDTEEEPTFILRPLKRINEKKDLADLEYEGKSVVLTRNNTEPNNASITSQSQAVVTNEDGNWFIEDTSGQGTTFIRVASKTELKDGDVLLLGNRLFEFHKVEE